MLAPYWLFALGALFVLVTIFLPKGILGLLVQRGCRRRQPIGLARLNRRARAVAGPAPDALNRDATHGSPAGDRLQPAE